MCVSRASAQTYPILTALEQEAAPLPLLGFHDYRYELQSRLQTWLIAGLRGLDEQAKAGRVGLWWVWSFNPKRGAGAQAVPPAPPGGSRLWPWVALLRSLGLQAPPPHWPRAGSSVRWKAPHSNQRGPIRAWRAPPLPTRGAAGPPAPARPALETLAWGRVNLLPRLLGSNRTALGYRRASWSVGGLPAAGTLWSAPCTESLSGDSVPTGTCPSTSPPSVSASRAGCAQRQKGDPCPRCWQARLEPPLSSSLFPPGASSTLSSSSVQSTGSSGRKLLATTCCPSTGARPVGSASLGWNNHAPVNLSETRVVTAEFPISRQFRSNHGLVAASGDLIHSFAMVQGPDGLLSVGVNLRGCNLIHSGDGSTVLQGRPPSQEGPRSAFGS